MRTVLVAAGVIFESGKVLLSQRKAGAHLAGMWEFPGGKVDEGEDPRAALSRELKEELGIDTVVGDVIEVTFHHCAEAEKAVLLLFFEATRTAASPAPEALDVAAFKWAAAADLDPADFPPADVAILKKIIPRVS
jgi:8-oxo-dGTP diphosphatase